MNTFHNLNAQLNLPQDGVINLKADKEAVRAYFIEYVNKHTRFFHSLSEKTEYMLNNELWSRDTVEVFPFEDFKELFKIAYSYKFRFESLLGAIKFYSTYALKDMDGETILERFEDRVVMTAIHLSGGDLAQAEDLIRIIITGRFQPATPTFLNAGRAKGGEMVSCFLLRMEDNLESIARVYASGMQLSKRGGGVGILLTNMRESGAPLKGVPGVGRGIVPIMKNLEDQFSHIDQLGMRQGAGAVYLNAHHPDIMQFLDTKRENADEKIRIKTLSLGVVIPDITFHLAKDNKDMYLFSPYDVERVEGKPMSECSVTENYHKWVEDERITKKKVSARRFFQTLSEIQFESGYPYVTFEDTANKNHAMKHAGTINMSNLCVTGDTRLNTDLGYMKAIDLHRSQQDFQVVVDNRAVDMDLANVGTKVTASTKMFKTAKNAKTYKVATKEGFEIKATDWHKFYVDRGNQIVKIPLNELVVGDKVLVQGGESAFGTLHEPELARLAGLIYADGDISDSCGAKVMLHGEKQALREQAELDAAFVMKKHDDLYRVENRTYVKPKFREDSNRLTMQSVPLRKILNFFGWDKKGGIPEFVFRGDRETQQAFLSAYLSLDGCIHDHGKKWHYAIKSVDPKGLREVQQLLLGFGIYGRISLEREAGNAVGDFGRGEVTYAYQRTEKLVVTDLSSRRSLVEVVDFLPKDAGKIGNLEGDVVRYPSRHKFRATVSAIEFNGVEDVYDVTVDDGNSVIFNGIVTGNCSEIAQLNSASTMEDDLTYTHVGDDISCNLGSLNVQKMLELDREEFIGTVRVAVRALDQVSRLTDIAAVPTVAQGNRKSRSIGLGQMNLHGALAHNMLEYGSEEALTLWDNYMALVTYAAMQESVELAKEHGTHAYWDGCEYQTGEWFRRTTDVWLEKGGHMAPTILGNLRTPGVEEWGELEGEVRRNGMANAYLQTIPPTGSISYINNSTSSIHPIASKIEIRKEGKIGRVYYPAPHMRTENLHLYKDAYEIGYEKLIDTYAVSQHWIDQSQSCTLFFPADATTRDLDRSRIYAWRKGLKSLYYLRIRQLGLEGTRVGEDVNECVACQL